uniref:Uncharacterized protein n=1 Tax=Capsaspora owczarzaki TaxID=192875 RepID=M1JET0_9EUKA|nr:hypothetical protein [Capsaspora owczarzaki]
MVKILHVLYEKGKNFMHYVLYYMRRVKFCIYYMRRVKILCIMYYIIWEGYNFYALCIILYEKGKILHVLYEMVKILHVLYEKGKNLMYYVLYTWNCLVLCEMVKFCIYYVKW